MDNLAHKMLHTFEKMDPINPTFDQLVTFCNIIASFVINSEIWKILYQGDQRKPKSRFNTKNIYPHTSSKNPSLILPSSKCLEGLL